MPEKNFELITLWPWVTGLSLLGGITSFMDKVSKGMRPGVLNFIKETTTAGFSGFITYILVVGLLGVDPGVASAVAGISAHYSTKSLALFEGILDRMLQKISGTKGE